MWRRLGITFLGFLSVVTAIAATTPVAEGIYIRDAAGWWRDLRVCDLGGAPLVTGGKWIVVAFLGQECPVSNACLPRLNQLAADFGARGCAFVGAYVDPTADLAVLRTHASDYGINFPVVDDREHRLTRAAGASYTPEVVVFSIDGTKLYRGSIDDRVGDSGAARPAAVHEHLREFLADLVAGKAGPFRSHPGYGCLIPQAVGR